MSQTLNFCFKGARNYVHGTDVVSELLKVFVNHDINDIDLKFSGIAETNLSLIEGHERSDAKVSICLKESGVEKRFQLVESGEKIDCRYEYDEDQIIEACVIDLENQVFD